MVLKLSRARADRSTEGSSSRAAPLPEDEDQRIEKLYALNLFDTASEQRFDGYTSLVAELVDFPVALVTLIDRSRQWFKSACGLNFRETERDVSFCAHAIRHHGVMVVPDARKDRRFADNPLVTGHPYVRFYAGAVIHGAGGRALGTLCMIEHEPRELDETHCS